MSGLHVDPVLLSQIPALLAIVAAAVANRQLDIWARAWMTEGLLLLGAAMMLPWLAGAVLILAVLALRAAFMAANRLKIAMNGMPVTWTDLIITRRHPGVLFHVFGFDPRLWMPVTVLAALAASAGLAWGLSKLLPEANLAGAAAVAVNTVALISVSRAYQKKLVRVVSERIATADHLFGDEKKGADGSPIEHWDPEAFVQLSHHMGPVGFLLYTQRLGTRFNMPLQERARPVKTGSPPDPLELEAAYVSSKPSPSGPGLLPNIVLMQIESGMNPNWAFNLDMPVRSALLDPGPDTRLLLPTRANVVGGGSWVSEFEALTGLDVRLFGYLGYYSHTSIGPYIEGALPAYLRACGYRTHAFYSTVGEFYRTREAFARYGFNHFSDSHDLGISDWTASDPEFIAASRKLMWDGGSKPLFAFLVTNGTHSPFAAVPQAQFRTRLRGEPGPVSARLNGYLEKFSAAEEAVLTVHGDLQRLSAETGRPYILVLYGDHQPSMFVNNPHLDFSAYRTAAAVTETFVHIKSNLEQPRLELSSSAAIAMVPTLLSSFVPAGLPPYAPFNYYLHRVFGGDFFPNFKFGGALGAFGGVDHFDRSLTSNLTDAAQVHQETSLRMIRESGILRREFLSRH